MNFVEELRWRGMVHNVTPEAEAILNEGCVTGYVGFDPTADSLTIGNLAAVMLLAHFQRAGHRPIALMGGATGRVGDPSGKSAERTLLSVEKLNANLAGQKEQMKKLLDFDHPENGAILVNNYDWFGNMNVLDFLREIGKHLTVNYMLAKDSVKTRMESGISFTEFSYQLIQGYDFKWLNDNYNCQIQMGGSDQWGNMTAGMELIRRMGDGEEKAKVGVITCPLITKADGTKFGKSESGNVWLDPKLTSPYKFYQFWLNSSDADVSKYIRIFTFLDQTEIEQLEAEHAQDPGRRILQKRLAEDVTKRVHGEEGLQNALNASQILFGRSTQETLRSLSKQDFLDVFSGVPQFKVAKTDLDAGIPLIDFLAVSTSIYSSKGEARKALKGNAVSINKVKEKAQDRQVNAADLLQDNYIIVQKGKKKFNLVIVE